jgi:hypothetical protein
MTTLGESFLNFFISGSSLTEDCVRKRRRFLLWKSRVVVLQAANYCRVPNCALFPLPQGDCRIAGGGEAGAEVCLDESWYIVDTSGMVDRLLVNLVVGCW